MRSTRTPAAMPSSPSSRYATCRSAASWSRMRRGAGRRHSAQLGSAAGTGRGSYRRADRAPAGERAPLLACASVEGDDFAAEMVAELAVAACPRRRHLPQRQPAAAAPPGAAGGLAASERRPALDLPLHPSPVPEVPLRPARCRWSGCGCTGQWRPAWTGSVASDAEERERIGARLAWHYEQAGLPLQAARALL